MAVAPSLVVINLYDLNIIIFNILSTKILNNLQENEFFLRLTGEKA